MPWTLEIDDEHLATWRPISSTFRFKSRRPPKEWERKHYHVGILFQTGVYEVIDRHRGDHAACELKHVRLNYISRGKREELIIPRSDFEELGLWVNIVPAWKRSQGPVVETDAWDYDALFGADGKLDPQRDFFTPYGGGITAWPERKTMPGDGGKKMFYVMRVYAEANTPHHAWYKFWFPMESTAVATLRVKKGKRLPRRLRPGVFSLAPPFSLPRCGGREVPSIAVEQYGIPPDGDEKDPPGKPRP